MFNLTIAGNLGKDAELRQVNGANGATSVANFSVAVKTSKKDQDGKPVTEWVECSLWGKRAEALAQYLTKGTVVSISGEPKASHYSTQNNEVRSKLTLTVGELTLLGGGKSQQQGVGQTQNQGYQQQAGQPMQNQGYQQPNQPMQNQQQPMNNGFAQQSQMQNQQQPMQPQPMAQGAGGSYAYEDDNVPFAQAERGMFA